MSVDCSTCVIEQQVQDQTCLHMPAMCVAQALTDERRLRAFTQSEAASQPQAGGVFSMYGGSVQVRHYRV